MEYYTWFDRRGANDDIGCGSGYGISEGVGSRHKGIYFATPATPIEVVLGKITPYLLVGYADTCDCYIGNPRYGGANTICFTLLAGLPYIVANLSVGLLISTVARTQIQASAFSFAFIDAIRFFFPFRVARLIGRSGL